MSGSGDDGFLARWARRKADARRGVEPQEPPPVAGAPATPHGIPQPAGAHAPVARPSHGAQGMGAAGAAPAQAVAAVPPSPPPPPTLDDVGRLTRESDYARFVAADVDPGVRNAAMRKLFTDPQFNQMDRLDVYIDDYGKPDPLPPAMLRRLAQSRFLGLFDDEPQADHPASGPVVATAPTATPAPPDEDPDLRLQSDDAAGRELHRPDHPGPGEDPAGQH